MRHAVDIPALYPASFPGDQFPGDRPTIYKIVSFSVLFMVRPYGDLT